MRAADIRRTFLEFFRGKGHQVVASSPVVPFEDPTLLFANAGMNQFKSVFTGHETREYTRAATTQKCIRAGGKHNDLDAVGYTARHLTFFEMLGNFSFGDYFKEDACRWAWELVTEHLQLDPALLWITVFHEDDEARAIWRDRIGVPNDRIVGLGEKDNYWSMGDVGPCGPCSEIFYDRGEAAGCGPHCGIGKCECDRFMEFWNLVFMQFEQRADGTKVRLPRPSIDTGMGLERIAMVMQGARSVFDTDALASLVGEIARVTGRPAGPGPEGTPHRVIADHIRSLTFAIADGAYPSNEGRGYVLRRILRRAARYGYKLGANEPFIYRLVEFLGQTMGETFPEIVGRRDVIQKLLHAEEEQFGRTLRQGMTHFEEEVTGMAGRGTTVFPAHAAFFLHDTCGFPIDLTEQMAREHDFIVDRDGFEVLMDEQRERSRRTVTATPALALATAMPGSVVSAADLRQRLADHPPTQFTGYRELQGEGRVVAVFPDGDHVHVVLDRTPFYAEGGGQVGDTGVLAGEFFQLEVVDTRKFDGVFAHRCRLASGDRDALAPGVGLQATVDAARRLAVQRNHTATHLIHSALRRVLGEHVQQKGSLVSPERLRFDISHFEKISPSALRSVEEIVQEQILRDTEVITGEYRKEEALARGALAFFGEKYGDRVRVVQIGDFSVELCGGAHCERTGEIGGVLVLQEGSVSSGVRRVEASTGLGTLERARQAEDLLRELCSELKADREGLVERIQSLLEENKTLKSGKGKAAGAERDLLAELDQGAGERLVVAGLEIVTAVWPAVDMEEILRVVDALKRRPGARAFVLATHDETGVRFVVGSSLAAPRGKLHCGNVAREGAKILGGGGGGRPDMAQAGGKDVTQLGAALERMRTLLAEQAAGT
ncbi:MAG: alanine--tRNA ligase [Planctomycetota bacterium]